MRPPAHKLHQTVILLGWNDDSWSTWIAVWPMTHILFIDEAIQPEMSLIAEDDFSIKIRIIFKLLLSPNSRTYDASGGQTASVLALIWFCKAKIISHDVWETHLGFLQLKPQRQHYSRHYGHLFVSLVRKHSVLCLWIQILSTRRSIVNLIGRLLRPQIERNAVSVRATDSEFR